MALIATNAMAAAAVQPKHTEVGTMAIVCTQAIASGVASDSHYKLFFVGSGMTIVDCMMRYDTAVGTSNRYGHIGIASGGKTLVSSHALSLTYPGRGGADCALPYSCTADTTIFYTHGGASTAISNLIVTCFVAPTENVD